MMERTIHKIALRALAALFALISASCGEGGNSAGGKAYSGNSEVAVGLNGEWTLSFAPQPQKAARTPEDFRKLKGIKTVPASVPGCVQLDLQRAGIEPDASVGDNVYKYRKYEGYEWMYSRSFKKPALKDGQRAVLNMRGVDTLADVFVNGKLVGSPENMFIEHEFDITDFLKAKGENTVDVIIRSPVLESKKYDMIFGSGNYERTEYMNIRKAPSGFGWDIHPRLVTAGLWRDISVDVRNPVRIDDMYCYTTSLDAKKRTANLCVDLQIDAPHSMLEDLRAVIEVSKDGKVVHRDEQPVFTYVAKRGLSLKNVDAWWPRGYGAQPLYDIKAEIVGKDGKALASLVKRVGFRTVRLEFKELELPAESGIKIAGHSAFGDTAKKLKGEFKFYVNSVPVFIKGTNWVPLDAFHSRDSQHVAKAIDMIVDLNCNMIRCWGGNVYEDSEFFDLCDKYGILVWQDFSLACSVYPQNSDFAKKVEKEVASVVKKLRNHPSLAIWAGNNENDASYSWRPIKKEPAHDRISRQTIPNTLYEYDWTRPYIPSSPYLSDKAVYEPEKYAPPEVHLWGPRGYYKIPFYKKSLAPFVSEIGYHGCPNRSSIEKMMTKKYVYPWEKDGSFNKEWQAKATMAFKNGKTETRRNYLMTKQAKLLFGECPSDLDDFIFASQVVQAEAKKYFIELWRTQKFDPKTGILWWNLRDGWPILSDAIVDYYNSKKLAYYYIKRVQEDVCVMVNDDFQLIAANDTMRPAKGSVKVADVDSGKVVFSSDFRVPENSKSLVADLPKFDGQGMLLIEYDVEGAPKLNHYMYGSPPFSLSKYKNWFGKLNVKRD